MGKTIMKAAKAMPIAEELVEKLELFCERVEIAGSLRRGKEIVGDIDLVAIPDTPNSLLGFFAKERIKPSGGAKYMKFQFCEVPVDLYIATAKTWATLLLIRTGSAGHNIKLCKRARDLGYQLHADGSGLQALHDDHPLLQCDSEQRLFEMLDLPFKEPRERG